MIPVLVYTNCNRVELFLNGTSLGRRQRSSADWPAAGLRWDVKFREGANQLRAVGYRDGKQFADEISTSYQTAIWSKPAKLVLKEISRTNGLGKGVSSNAALGARIETFAKNVLDALPATMKTPGAH